MIRIRCKCGKYFMTDEDKIEDFMDSLAIIYACPYCSKSWRKTKKSGIKWRVYPQEKKLVESYIKIK